MSSTLLALSPLDGRYARKVAPLRPVFSEYGLMHRRVQVEVRWLLALADEPGLAEVAPFADAARARLLALADDFSEADAARIKDIEATTNHDVKAVEYFIKEAMQADPALAEAREFVHFACTSEDINNLAYALMLRDAREGVLLPALDGILASLRASRRWKSAARSMAPWATTTRTRSPAPKWTGQRSRDASSKASASPSTRGRRRSNRMTASRSSATRSAAPTRC